MTTMLPDAIERERESLMEASMGLLRKRGYEQFEAHELPGHPEPAPVTVPVLNIHITPDLRAVHATEGTLLGVVEPESDLGEEACGRRWQGLAAWADQHQAQVQVFVHEEDKTRARDIARHWHLDEAMIQTVPRH